MRASIVAWLAVNGLALASCGELFQDRFRSGYGSIVGQVVDENDLPVKAMISTLDEDSVVLVRGQTDEVGRFFLSDVPIGAHRLAAYDARAHTGVRRVVVIAEQTTMVEKLSLGPADPALLPSLLLERRLTDGEEVVEVHLALSGRVLLFQTSDPDGATSWHLLRRRIAGDEESGFVATEVGADLPGPVAGVDDRFVYGVDESPDANNTIWRAPLDDPGSVQKSSPFENAIGVRCLGMSAEGLVCSSVVPESIFLELWMDGDLGLWRPDEPEARVVLANYPDGMEQLTFSPDRRTVALVPKTFNEIRTNQLVLFDLAGGSSRSFEATQVKHMAFDPQGRLLAIEQIEDTYRALLLPEEVRAAIPVGEGQYLARLGFDVMWNEWAALIDLGQALTTVRIGYADGGGGAGLVIGTTEQLPQNMVWQIGPDGLTAGEAQVGRFMQIILLSSDGAVPLTMLAADHSLVGWTNRTDELVFTTRDPLTGVEQLFTVYTEGDP